MVRKNNLTNNCSNTREFMKDRKLSFIMLDMNMPVDQAEHISKEAVKSLLELKEECFSEDVNKIKVLLSAVRTLEEFFMCQSFIRSDNKKITRSWVCDLLHDELSNKIDTIFEAEVIGAFVQALFLLGSSRKQAIEGVAVWAMMSETKVRRANQVYRDEHDREDISQNLIRFHRDYNDLIQSIAKAFPDEDYKKAGNAYKALIIQVNEMCGIVDGT